MQKIMSVFLSLFTISSLLIFQACDDQVADTTKASVISYDVTAGSLKDFEISPQDAKLFAQDESAVRLIDVREPSEFKEYHIENAINIPLSQLSKEILEQNGVTKIDYAILYCRSGNRSAQAYEIMQSLGYYNSNSIAGGILKWTEIGLPVIVD